MKTNSDGTAITMSQVRNRHRRYLKPIHADALRIYRNALPEDYEETAADREMVRSTVRQECLSLKAFARKHGLFEVIRTAHETASQKPNGVSKKGKK